MLFWKNRGQAKIRLIVGFPRFFDAGSSNLILPFAGLFICFYIMVGLALSVEYILIVPSWDIFMDNPFFASIDATDSPVPFTPVMTTFEMSMTDP